MRILAPVRWPGLLGIAILAGGVAACGGRAPAALDAERSTSRCASFAPGREVGRVTSPMLDEISGVVASRAQPGVLFVHDDSGTGALVFAIDLEGTLLGQWTYQGAPSFDWEDIAIEVVPGAPDRLWLGDVGDNRARHSSADARSSITIVRIEEPTIDRARAPIVETRTTFDTITLRYPDRPHDCEAIAIDPQTGDLLLVAKEGGGTSGVFRLPAPVADGADVVLEELGTIEAGPMVTASDIAPDARELIVRTYRSVLLWERFPEQTWSEAIARTPRVMPSAAEPQGESITFTADGSAYLTIGEGENVPIWLYERRCP